MSLPQSIVDLAPEAEKLTRTYMQRVAVTLDDFLAEKALEVGSITTSAVALVDAIKALTRGGKRLRPAFAFWGFLGAGGQSETNDIVKVGVALELFQAAALIHDDLIDRSDTRRGQPSVHKRFEAQHLELQLDGDPAHYGGASAILAGDLCLSLSEEVFASVESVGPAARKIFNQMRTQVMAGQYLDILEESAGSSYDPAEAVKRARTIVRYKSAKYSTENPFLLGGALAGAGPELLASYQAFALPLGEAFQLRDDVLGVFGDPSVTGKPAGDDLREGKRTELIAHAMLLADTESKSLIARRLGAPDLRDDEVEQISTILRECGALAETETDIAQLTNDAMAAMSKIPVHDLALAGMSFLSDAVTKRSK
ncbi:polyprenyl synthetase family protein [Glutamicibacter sp. MNS18]|uniref:polyprenyl synthetase family protein n=1 Tax=Glutamicibacter sp. MNS18 TaxID=2989817 RepID=UPI002235441C|nr:polyprenyl synthetase family protein [Glutamicibacter sp. MNS18]MCW4464406.1 polyprenyl synthetase family protein [Glutamicibacter sp. MNS18]